MVRVLFRKRSPETVFHHRLGHRNTPRWVLTCQQANTLRVTTPISAVLVADSLILHQTLAMSSLRLGRGVYTSDQRRPFVFKEGTVHEDSRY